MGVFTNSDSVPVYMLRILTAIFIHIGIAFLGKLTATEDLLFGRGT
jgi:hypothetical protein